eukprot:4910537-Amphidinium_carterae.1
MEELPAEGLQPGNLKLILPDGSSPGLSPLNRWSDMRVGEGHTSSVSTEGVGDGMLYWLYNCELDEERAHLGLGNTHWNALGVIMSNSQSHMIWVRHTG